MNATRVAEDRAAPSPFGVLLKRLRTDADLTQEELAERAGVSARLVSDLERGVIRRPRRDTVRLLADGLALAEPERTRFASAARGRPDGAPEATDAAAHHEPGPESGPPWAPLPAPPSAIFGRDEEIAAAGALLARPDVRLVTLSGPGGVGKTRLALTVAANAAAAFGGAAFVDLAPRDDPALVVPAIAEALDLRPAPTQSPYRAVVEALRGRPALLVLDNFERLIPAAADLARLLADCPRLTLLVTSRLPLRIRAEWDFAVGPLALPDLGALPPPEHLARVPAVALFVARAQAGNRHFGLSDANAPAIAEVVTRLDGLPLAIELAAARSAVLPPAALRDRLERRLPLLTGGLRDLPIRQQALRATIGWSHDLLDDAQRRLFRRVAVFSGGCPLDAVEAVVADEATGRAGSVLLDGIPGLLDHGLVRQVGGADGDARFGMLETIREFGLECLAEAGEDGAIRDRHVAWGVALAERADPELVGADQARWFGRLEADHDNLRAALEWAIGRGDAASALRLAGALYRFWANRGLYHEGRRWFDRALALEADAPPTARGCALLGAGVMDYFLGDYARAAARWHEALRVHRALGDTRGIAYSYGNLGLVADAEGDYPRAAASYGQALALFREMDDRTYTGFMLGNLGLIAWFEHDLPRAAALFSEALAIARELDDRNSVAMTLGNLASVALAGNDRPRALALIREALMTGRGAGNRPWLAKGVETFAQVVAATDPLLAARLFGAAEAARRETGAATSPNDRAINDRHVAAARTALGDGRFLAVREDGRALPLEAAVEAALAHLG